MTINLNYTLFAPKPGIITLAPVILDDGEQKYATKPIKIKVSGRTLPKEDKLSPYLEEGIDI